MFGSAGKGLGFVRSTSARERGHLPDWEEGKFVEKAVSEMYRKEAAGTRLPALQEWKKFRVWAEQTRSRTTRWGYRSVPLMVGRNAQGRS